MRSLIDAVRRHFKGFSMRSLIGVLADHRRRGRPGIDRFEQFIIHVLGTKVSDSEFERWVWGDLQAAGEPLPEYHTTVLLPGGEEFELDFAWSPVRYNLETDGGDHIERTARVKADKLRDRRLVAAGWTVARLDVDSYVRDGPAELAAVRAEVMRRFRAGGW
jgi:very-short-patch-repair endonuclease